MSEIKPFARQGNFTAVDNAVFDEIMPELTNSEWKVLCLIIRKTVGWDKEMDGIAYSQLRGGTGIASNTTIQKAISGLLKKRIIEQGKTKELTDPHFYRLNRDYTCRVTESVKRPVTFSVKRPVTENVNTKERKEKENNSSGDFSKVVNAYENNIGTITSRAGELIKAAVDEYPIDWIIEAINIAAENNVRKWSYVDGILKKWESAGRGDKVVDSNIANAWAEVKLKASKPEKPIFTDNRILEAVRPLWPELKAMTSFTERELRMRFERNYNVVN